MLGKTLRLASIPVAFFMAAACVVAATNDQQAFEEKIFYPAKSKGPLDISVRIEGQARYRVEGRGPDGEWFYLCWERVPQQSAPDAWILLAEHRLKSGGFSLTHRKPQEVGCNSIVSELSPDGDAVQRRLHSAKVNVIGGYVLLIATPNSKCAAIDLVDAQSSGPRDFFVELCPGTVSFVLPGLPNTAYELEKTVRIEWRDQSQEPVIYKLMQRCIETESEFAVQAPIDVLGSPKLIDGEPRLVTVNGELHQDGIVEFLLGRLSPVP